MTYSPHTFGKSKSAVNLIKTVQKLYNPKQADKILARVSAFLSQYQAGLWLIKNSMRVICESYHEHMLIVWRNEYLRMADLFPDPVSRFLHSIVVGRAREISKLHRLWRIRRKNMQRIKYN